MLFIWAKKEIIIPMSYNTNPQTSHSSSKIHTFLIFTTRHLICISKSCLYSYSHLQASPIWDLPVSLLPRPCTAQISWDATVVCPPWMSRDVSHLLHLWMGWYSWMEQKKYELCLASVFVQLHFNSWRIRTRKVHLGLLLGFAATDLPVNGILLHKQNQLFFTC